MTYEKELDNKIVDSINCLIEIVAENKRLMVENKVLRNDVLQLRQRLKIQDQLEVMAQDGCLFELAVELLPLEVSSRLARCILFNGPFKDRTFGSLKLFELIQLQENSILRLKNVGSKSLVELKQGLKELGLDLGILLPEHIKAKYKKKISQ